MGRPTKLTPQLQAKICNYIEWGNTYERACLLCNIAPRTFHYWKARGEKATRGKFLQFLQAVLRAEEKGIAFHIGVVMKAAKGGEWRASTWYLERKRPDEFGRRLAVQAEGRIEHEHFVNPEAKKKLEVIFRGEQEIDGDKLAESLPVN